MQCAPGIPPVCEVVKKSSGRFVATVATELEKVKGFIDGCLALPWALFQGLLDPPPPKKKKTKKQQK